MIKSLNKSKEEINKIRFSKDIKNNNIEYPSASQYEELMNSLFLNNMLVSKELTPKLHSAITSVCNQLSIPDNNIKSFIDPSNDIQASCLIISHNEAIMKFSSRLINLLNEKELKFVIGHELGHFLLNHGTVNHGEINDNIITYGANMKSRYQEISADRVGLIASNCIDSAFGAMFKLMTGLTDNNLNINISAYLSQIDNMKNLFSEGNLLSTHPSNIIRCRSLLWFSMTNLFSTNMKKYTLQEIEDLDNKIENDLKNYQDGPLIDQIEKLKNIFKLWYSMSEIIKDGLFDKNEQTIFKEMFDDNELESMKSFLNGLRSEEIVSVINSKISESETNLQMLLPMEFEEELELIKNMVINKFQFK